MPKLIIGFISYNELTSKYLPFFIESLLVQSFQDFFIEVIDNSDEKDNGNYKYLKNHGRVNVEWAGENAGYGKTYNKLIKKAKEKKAKYFLALNPDMILEPNAIAKMVKVLDADSELGSVSPKVLRWDFENSKKTNNIDTLGIIMKSGLRFVDLGQGEEDNHQYDNEYILGPSGCAAMYRMEALGRVREGESYFDDLMFMYKEDCDLAYRLFLAGFKSRIVPEAIVYHDRTASAQGESDLKVVKNRKNKSVQVKRWSFLNQNIIFLKYWRLQNFWNKLNILVYGFKMFIYVLFFERYLLGEYKKLFQIWGKIKRY